MPRAEPLQLKAAACQTFTGNIPGKPWRPIERTSNNYYYYPAHVMCAESLRLLPFLARPLCLSVFATPPLSPSLILPYCCLRKSTNFAASEYSATCRDRRCSLPLGPPSYQALLDLWLALYHEAVGLQLVDGSMSLARGRHSPSCVIGRDPK